MMSLICYACLLIIMFASLLLLTPYNRGTNKGIMIAVNEFVQKSFLKFVIWRTCFRQKRETAFYYTHTLSLNISEEPRLKLTWMRTHGEVRWVVFPGLKVSGVLHRAVAAWRHPRSGAVNQRAPLRQEVVRRSEISAFHPRREAINPKSQRKIRRHRRSQATQMQNNPFLWTSGSPRIQRSFSFAG